jgi:hypothetical protein
VKITFAFIRTADGTGYIRAHITDQLGIGVLIVGCYAKDAGVSTYTARLFAKAGDPSTTVRHITKPTVHGLRNALALEVGKGRWWQ